MSLLNRSLGPLLFPNILWRSNDASVHLTFDDGPHPSATPQVLELLQRYEIRATFFLVGTQVMKYPDLARQIIRSGHTVGSHSMTHRSLFLRSRSAQQTEITAAKTIIRENVGISPQAFRPPYGHFDFFTIDASVTAQQKIVMWDVDSRDFSPRSPEQIASRVCRHTRPGSIILFHDNDLTADRSASHLTLILDDLVERGFHFAPVPL